MNRPAPFDPDADRLERRMAAQPWRTPPADLKARILAGAIASAQREPRAASRSWRWSELLWPGPWAWGAMAAVWVAVMAFGLGAEQTARRGGTLAGRARQSPAPVWVDWQQQQAFLTALLEEEPPSPRPPAVLRPRSALPPPRFGSSPGRFPRWDPNPVGRGSRQAVRAAANDVVVSPHAHGSPGDSPYQGGGIHPTWCEA